MDELEIYTSLEDAGEEIWKRWNNKELRRKVEDFLGGDILESFKKEPRAYLVRGIVSPNFELFNFLNLANRVGLSSVCLEYSNDKFTSKNSEKYHLGRMFFYDGKGKRGGEKITTKMVIDFNNSEGKKLNQIKTLWGSNLIDFHHKLLKDNSCKGLDSSVDDISLWIDRNGKKPEFFYSNYLALFICHGVLFENFLCEGDELSFTTNVVLPSLNKIKEIFGVKPLIVPVIPIDRENELYWNCYSSHIKDFITKIFKNKKDGI